MTTTHRSIRAELAENTSCSRFRPGGMRTWTLSRAPFPLLVDETGVDHGLVSQHGHRRAAELRRHLSIGPSKRQDRRRPSPLDRHLARKGSAVAHWDTAAALADAGFVVAALTHPATTIRSLRDGEQGRPLSTLIRVGPAAAAKRNGPNEDERFRDGGVSRLCDQPRPSGRGGAANWRD